MDKLLLPMARAVGRSAAEKASQVTTTLTGFRKKEDTAAPLLETEHAERLSVTTLGASSAGEQGHDTDAIHVGPWADGGGRDQLPSEHQPGDHVEETVMSRIEFDRLCQSLSVHELPERGDTESEKASWCVRRRFSVKLGGLLLENLGSEHRSSVFAIMIFGGNQVEVRVYDENKKKTYPRLAGYPGEVFTTAAVDTPAGQPVEIPFQAAIEWRGSYLHLEKEFFTIELWQYKSGLNRLLCSQREPLLNFVDSSVAHTAVLESTTRETSQEMFRVALQLEFQEIYDYELNFYSFRIAPVSPSVPLTETKQQQPADVLKETVAKLFEGFKGRPILNVTIAPNVRNRWPMRTHSRPCQDPIKDFAEFTGGVIFRGTSYELEASEFTVTIRDSSKPFYSKASGEYKATIPVRNVLETPSFSWPLSRNNTVVATLTGTCGIPYMTKYKQTGQVLDIDDSHLYVFFKIIRVDQLPHALNPVQYDGQIKQTTRIINSITPHYQSELPFIVRVPDVNAMTADDILARGPAVVDLWCGTDKGKQHLGWTQIHLGEILRDKQGVDRRVQVKRYLDRRQNKEMTYETRTLATSHRLVALDGEAAITLFFECWTKPDLGQLQLPVPQPPSSTPAIPASLSSRLPPLVAAWEKELSLVSHGRRQFGCLAVNHRGHLLPYNTFVTPLHPVVENWTMFDMFAFVRCIPFVEAETGRYLRACSFDFFMRYRRGSAFMHHVLFASLLIGRHIPAFVCLGTTVTGEPYSSVLTLDKHPETGRSQALFWDARDATIYDIGAMFPKAFDPAAEEASSVLHSGLESKLSCPPPSSSDKRMIALTLSRSTAQCPYRSLDVIFHDRQIWGNLHAASLQKTTFDFNDSALWLKFYTSDENVVESSFPRNLALSPPDRADAAKMAKTFHAEIMQYIQTMRYQMSKTAVTQWVCPRNFAGFLEQGASLLGSLERTDPAETATPTHKALETWKAALFARTPRDYRLRWLHLAFNHRDAKRIARDIWDAVPLLREIDRSQPMPGELSQTDIILVAVSRMKGTTLVGHAS